MFCSLFICVRFGSAVKTLQMRWLHSLLVSGVLNAILTCSESLEEDLSGDGGVLKRCLRTGTGSALPQGESGSIVRATVRGPIAVSPSGEVLDDPGKTRPNMAVAYSTDPPHLLASICLMGNTPFCGNCSELCLELVAEVRCDQPEKDMIHTIRKLFELTDVDGDGLISLDDFVLMGLHQTKLHSGPQKPRTRHEEERVKEAFVQRFAHEIDASFQAAPYYKYKEYLLRCVDQLHPGDIKAQSVTLNGVLIDATIAHDRIMLDKALHAQAPRLPTILTSITEIILGQGQISRGLDMAIGSMREKEEALIRLSASYAPKNRISEDATFKLEVLKFDLLDASSLHRGPTGLRLFQRTLSVAAMEEVVIGSTQAPGGIGQLQMELKTDGKGCYRMLMIGLGHA
eukprot:s1396_g4.t2